MRPPEGCPQSRVGPAAANAGGLSPRHGRPVGLILSGVLAFLLPAAARGSPHGAGAPPLL